MRQQRRGIQPSNPKSKIIYPELYKGVPGSRGGCLLPNYLEILDRALLPQIEQLREIIIFFPVNLIKPLEKNTRQLSVQTPSQTLARRCMLTNYERTGDHVGVLDDTHNIFKSSEIANAGRRVRAFAD